MALDIDLIHWSLRSDARVLALSGRSWDRLLACRGGRPGAVVPAVGELSVGIAAAFCVAWRAKSVQTGQTRVARKLLTGSLNPTTFRALTRWPPVGSLVARRKP